MLQRVTCRRVGRVSDDEVDRVALYVVIGWSSVHYDHWTDHSHSSQTDITTTTDDAARRRH